MLHLNGSAYQFHFQILEEVNIGQELVDRAEDLNSVHVLYRFKGF